jgi:hypothetical protein
MFEGEYERERLALYLTGLLPSDVAEARAVLELCGQILPILAESRAEREQEREDA